MKIINDNTSTSNIPLPPPLPLTQDFDEVPQAEIELTHPDRLRDTMFTPEPIARADFFVNCPKFKAHPWTTVTFSLKNYIGIHPWAPCAPK